MEYRKASNSTLFSSALASEGAMYFSAMTVEMKLDILSLREPIHLIRDAVTELIKFVLRVFRQVYKRVSARLAADIMNTSMIPRKVKSEPLCRKPFTA